MTSPLEDKDSFARFLYEQSSPENRVANTRQRILREFLLPLTDPVFSRPVEPVAVAEMLEGLAARFRNPTGGQEP